jgi:hypothetical protein
VTFVSDAGLEQGIQRITYRKGGQTGHVTVMVTANTAYIRGDAFVLLNYFGFRRISAVNYSGRWVRYPRRDRAYAAVSAGVTLQSLVDGLAVKGKLASAPGNTIDGQQVLGVTGKASSSAGTVVDTVYARAAGSPLPMRQVTTRGPKDVTTTIFSKWSGPVTVTAPKASVAISVIRKASPTVS